VSTTGFVGLRSMGAPIAGRLLQGHVVYGTNRTSTAAQMGYGHRDIAA
jgi:3-hydroxyisobutyrate dehydrogenase-like beta-hydroxyacid dehydrogenase